MDETLAELFARHPSCGCFKGNPMDAFGAFIAGEEYGVDEGFTGGGTRSCFNQVSRGKLCVQKRSKLTPVLFSFQVLILCRTKLITTC